MYWFQLCRRLSRCSVAHLAVMDEAVLLSLCGNEFFVDLVEDVAAPGADPRPFEIAADAFCGACLHRLLAGEHGEFGGCDPLGDSGGSVRAAVLARRDILDAVDRVRAAKTVKYVADSLVRHCVQDGAAAHGKPDSDAWWGQ